MVERTAEEGHVARALGELVAAYGPATLSDPGTLRALLNDHLGAAATGLRREVKLVTDAATEGIPAALAASSVPGHPSDGTAQVTRLVRLGMAEPAARFAVSAWAAALGNPLTAALPGTVASAPTPGGQPWGPTLIGATNTARGQAPVEPSPHPRRRRLAVLATVIGLVVVGGGLAVGIAMTGGGDDEPFATGSAGAVALRSLLPSGVMLDGDMREGAAFHDDITEICGVSRQPVTTSAGYRYGPTPNGTLAVTQADAYPSADAAAAYLTESRAKLAGCAPYEAPLDNYPNTVAAVALDTDFPGPGLRYSITYDCRCSSQPDAADNLLIEQLYRIVQVENVVAHIAVSSQTAVAERELQTLEDTTDAVHARMREAIGD